MANPPSPLRQVQIVYGSLVGALLLVSLVSFGIGSRLTEHAAASATQVLLIAGVVAEIGAAALARYLFTRIIREMAKRPKATAEGAFMQATLVSGALLEGVGVLGGVVFFLTGHPLGFAITAFAAYDLYQVRPTDQRLEVARQLFAASQR